MEQRLGTTCVRQRSVGSLKPTPTDIIRAIEIIEADEWIDPLETPAFWACELYNPQGRYVGDGVADTPGIAMAMAWLCCWSPDALIDSETLDDVPLVVPDGYRFELTPPVELACLPWEAHSCVQPEDGEGD